MFDAYIFIDWSAANRVTPRNPCADSVWMGQLVRHHRQEETYHRTRTDCISRPLSVLLNHVTKGRKVLVGFDFPYGYPAGLCHALGFPSGSNEWLEIWTELANRVLDSDDNTNNRFAVASILNGIAGNGRSGPGHSAAKPKTQVSSFSLLRSRTFLGQPGSEGKRFRTAPGRFWTTLLSKLASRYTPTGALGSAPRRRMTLENQFLPKARQEGCRYNRCSHGGDGNGGLNIEHKRHQRQKARQ